jgi:hypothetical protein
MSGFLSRASQRLAELAELSADEGRLARGRALFRKGAVSDLLVTEGSIIASVRGSRGDGYETTVSTSLAPPGVRRQVADSSGDGRDIDEMIDDGIDVCPREIDLGFDCDCPDWDEPCKHVVAVVFAFADRVDLDEAQLLRWRGVDPPPLAPSTSRQPRSNRRTEAPAPAHRAARISRLESLLGDTAVRVPAAGDDESGPPPSALDPALSEFLGVDLKLDPIGLASPAADPLLTGVELGPLADLGPELARALTIIADRLRESAPAAET